MLEFSPVGRADFNRASTLGFAVPQQILSACQVLESLFPMVAVYLAVMSMQSYLRRLHTDGRTSEGQEWLTAPNNAKPLQLCDP